jgi:UDP-glucuronate decarboxylase
MTVEALARLIIRLSGSRSRIVRKPLPVDDPKVRQPDVRLAARELRWKPRVSPEAGLKITIDWFRRAWLDKRKEAYA